MQRRRVLLGLLVSLGSTLARRPAAAEPQRASGKSTDAAQILRTDIILGNDPGDTGRLDSIARTLTSEHPDWNGARVFSVRFSDPHARRERHVHGHMVVTHPTGEQTFYTYEFKWASTDPETDFTLTARLVQGTGKFRRARGTWQERGRSTMASDSSEWAIDYELR
jgi:hypothetical protein